MPDLSVVLTGRTTDVQTLRRVAGELASGLQELPNVSRVDIIGGSPRAIRVDLDARRLAERGLGAAQVVQAVQAGNVLLPGGTLSGPGGTFRIEAGGFLTSAEDVASLIVGANGAGPVYLRDVAAVVDGVGDPAGYVSQLDRSDAWTTHPAVTLTAIKLKGSNAATVTRRMRQVLDLRARTLLPPDVRMTYAHDTGATATESVDMALEHLVVAVVVAIVLVGAALGWREGLVTAIVLPVTLLSIPVAYALTGFTLNRITLAAMVFAIGLLIDNAIVVIENVHRHFRSQGSVDRPRIAARATQEIGAPTILATIMVVMALVPTAFVTGMTGQYLRALPIGASIGMAFSLFIALSLVPHLCVKLLHRGGGAESSGRGRTGRVLSLYHLLLAWILERRG
ncbi:MAG TPA: efflux RND transporter permease subunit, partial [Holophaga sp.]|nr:efflux RND transporter permease subunit [Holophaga sp.]